MRVRDTFLLCALLLAVCGGQLGARPPATPEPGKIIKRARSTVGTESALRDLVTLRIRGRIEPSDPKMPEALLVILAREPASQRLEVRVDDLIETTLVHGGEGVVIRSNVNEDASRMRPLTGEELKRAIINTRQFFSFYRPDAKHGETVRYAGIEQRRGVRCHKLVYEYPDGVTTKRFFAVNDDTLVATVSDNGVESVEKGRQVIDGIRFPEKVAYFEDGRKLHTIHLEEVAVNKPLEAGIFTIPEGRDEPPPEAK